MKAPEELVPANAGVVECSVRGCGWRAEIPPLYRIEVAPLDVATFGDPLATFVSTRVVPDDDAVAAFEAYLAGHLEQHAIAETLLEQLAPEVVDPPGWTDQEWCDGGTCEHSACLAALDARLEVDE